MFGPIPIIGEPMVLEQNCRNTGAVHRVAYRHYRGAAMIASPIEGTAVAAVTANGLEPQAKSVGALLTRLLVEEQIPAHDIAVLICDGASKAKCEGALASLHLPKTVRLRRLEDYGPNVVTVDTVARFKGLEREVVILWAFDGADPERDRETLYVGMSRAKAALYLCGSKESCARIAEAG